MTKAEKAKELFTAGANCAQAVLGAFHQECGLTLEQAYRLASGFGAGMARMREVCGTVSGMFMAADLIAGPSDLNDKAAKDAHYAWLQSLAEEFKRENGSIICRDLLGLTSHTPDSPVSEPRTQAYYKKRPCAELSASAAAILERALAKRQS